MELWKMCRAVNNANRLAMLREIARSPGRGLNVLQAGDFVGLGKAAASQYLRQLSEAGFLMVERSGNLSFVHAVRRRGSRLRGSRMCLRGPSLKRPGKAGRRRSLKR